MNENIVQRFLSVDPIAESFPHLTAYNYAENRPIDGIDLWGLQYVPFNMKDKFEGLFDYMFGTSFHTAKPSPKPSKTTYVKADVSLKGNLKAGAGLGANISTPVGKAKEEAIAGSWLLREFSIGSAGSEGSFLNENDYNYTRDLGVALKPTKENYVGVGIHQNIEMVDGKSKSNMVYGKLGLITQKGIFGLEYGSEQSSNEENSSKTETSFSFGVGGQAILGGEIEGEIKFTISNEK